LLSENLPAVLEASWYRSRPRAAHRYVYSKLVRVMEQIQFLLGHVSVHTTERYLLI